MLDEYSPLRRVGLRHPRDMFRDQDYVRRNWRAHDFEREPDMARTVREYETFLEALLETGAEPVWFDADARFAMASIYARDSCVRVPDGIVPARMGFPYRAEEPGIDAERYGALGYRVHPGIAPAGTLEGGDMVWFHEHLCAVGEGYRTNAEGIRQLRARLPEGVHLEVMHTPHFRGPDFCLHLMSLLSPVDSDLAVVYSPYMSVRFRRWLQEHLGMTFVEVPDAEFDQQGANVLALAPRKVMLAEGCPITHRRLEAAGCDVLTFPADDLCVAGVGGPTCLTRPLARG